jgi:hypothetical protein
METLCVCCFCAFLETIHDFHTNFIIAQEVRQMRYSLWNSVTCFLFKERK